MHKWQGENSIYKKKTILYGKNHGTMYVGTGATHGGRTL
jgi:hypothetical protein